MFFEVFFGLTSKFWQIAWPLNFAENFWPQFNYVAFSSSLAQTLDFALRVKCVATYGRIIAQDQSTVALFADGRASQYLNALEISAGRFLTAKAFWQSPFSST